MPQNISWKWQEIAFLWPFLSIMVFDYLSKFVVFQSVHRFAFSLLYIFIIMICFMIVHIYPIWIWQFLAVSKLCWYLIRWWLKPRSWTQLDKSKYLPDFNIFFEHSRPGYWYLIPQTNRCPTLIRPILCSDCFLVPT